MENKDLLNLQSQYYADNDQAMQGAGASAAMVMS